MRKRSNLTEPEIRDDVEFLCPSDDDLRQLARESLHPDVLAEIDAHVSHCVGCKQALGRLARECRSTDSDAPICLPPRRCPPTIPGFEIERELGRGAMGVVYLARDEKLGRSVALKVMPGAQSANGQVRRRWRAEAQAFSRVRHPNVVSLFEIGETDSWLYLVLEFIPGGTLKKRLAGPLMPEAAANLLARIAIAVERIHSTGLLHLDLKPSNILIDSEDNTPLDQVTTKVADFGIARLRLGDESAHAESDTAMAGTWGGTASYMAPEQISGNRSELGPGADIHALGAILYELLTGRPPFQGISLVDTLDLVRTRDAVSPRRINPRISRDLETITLKCLQKEPKKRYDSARSLADDLTRFREGRPITARAVFPPELAWRWCRRRPALAAALAALAATVLLSFIALHALYMQAVEERDRAESALVREVKNRQIASTLMGGLEGIIDGAARLRPLEGEEWRNAARLLREQVAKARTVPGFEHNSIHKFRILGQQLALELAKSKRWDEARLVIRGDIDFLRAHDEIDTGADGYRWDIVEAYLFASQIDNQATGAAEALGFLNQGATLLKHAARDDPSRPVYAAHFSGEYRQWEDRLARPAPLEQKLRARDGRIALLTLLHDDDRNRPDVMLFRACLIADDGDWNKASALAETVFELQSSVEVEPFRVRESIKELLVEWLARVIQHWNTAGIVDQAASLTPDQEIDRLFDFITRMSKAVTPERADSYCFSFGVFEFSRIAASHRKAGRLDQAARAVKLQTGLARALVRRFPGQAVWHSLLSEAYLQQSKNAWKTEDFSAIKRALEQSVASLERAMLLDPNDQSIRRDLLDRMRRLANLPKL